MGLEEDLRREPVSHLDLSAYIDVPRGTRVCDVLQQMRRARRTCVLVVESGRLVGIFTDRDVLQKVADAPATWDQAVDHFMTPDPQTVRPGDVVGDALRMMIAGHYRNVPVIAEDGTLCGNLTHFAIIKFLSDHFPEEIYNLPPEPEL